MCSTELQQRQLAKGRRSYKLVDDGHVDVCINTLTSAQSYRVPIAVLDPNIVRIRSTKLSNMIIASVFLLFALLVAQTFWNDGHLMNLWVVPALIGFFGCLFVLAHFRYREDNVLVHNHQGENVLTLFAASPSKEAVDAFVGELQSRIQARTKNLRAAAPCIDDLYRLGVISEEEAGVLMSRVSREDLQVIH